MPKLKTRKAATKRYKVANNNFLRKCAYKGHLLIKKSARQKRKLSTQVCVNLNDIKSIKLMIPYR